MPRKALIDSGPLVALFDKGDHYHENAINFMKKFNGEFFTSVAVLTEVCYLLDFSTHAQLDFLKWVKDVMLEEENNISEKDLELIQLVDTPEEAVAEINKFYKKYVHKPNF